MGAIGGARGRATDLGVGVDRDMGSVQCELIERGIERCDAT